MADYSINAVTRRVVYTGSAGAGPYAFSFEVLGQGDIAVYKNTTKLTLTSHYTVTINSNGTGSVTLTSPAISTDRITIIGSRAIERTTDFVTAGDLLAASLNEQLDSQIVMVQQVAEENKRTLKAPPYDPASSDDGGVLDMTLPPAATRVGKVLSFDANGNPETLKTLQELADANTSATAAAAQAVAAKVAAENARDATLLAYDNFDDRYLGAKSVAPTVDNDGNALIGGALYFDTVVQAMKMWTGSAWVYAYVTGSEYVEKANNLSDLPNKATARSNLELGTANNVTFNNVSDSIGNVRTVPANVQASTYTLTASDRGKHVFAAGNVTVPSGVFVAGDCTVIVNSTGSAITISQSGTTLRLVGSATTGNRTLNQYGLATLLCVGSNTFYVSGGGLL